MNIEFIIFKLKKDSKTYQQWSTKDYMQKELDCDIIIVGEEKLGDTLYLRGSTIQDGKLSLIGGLQLNDMAFHVPEEDLEYISCSAEFNIHKKYLSMGLVEDIQRINQRLVG
jgi:hypothetical protein